MGWKKDFPLWFQKFFVPITAIYGVIIIFLAKDVSVGKLLIIGASFVCAVFVFKFLLNYHSLNSFKAVELVRQQAECIEGFGVDKSKFIRSVNCDVVEEPKGVFAIRCEPLGKLFVFDTQTRLLLEHTNETIAQYLERVKNRLLASKIAEQKLKAITVLQEKELEEGGV